MLRVIAVEKAYPVTGKKPVKAAVYKNEKLYVFDNGEIFFCKEYFNDFSSLEYYVEGERYD